MRSNVRRSEQRFLVLSLGFMVGCARRAGRAGAPAPAARRAPAVRRAPAARRAPAERVRHGGRAPAAPSTGGTTGTGGTGTGGTPRHRRHDGQRWNRGRRRDRGQGGTPPARVALAAPAPAREARSSPAPQAEPRLRQVRSAVRRNGPGRQHVALHVPHHLRRHEAVSAADRVARLRQREHRVRHPDEQHRLRDRLRPVVPDTPTASSAGAATAATPPGSSRSTTRW